MQEWIDGINERLTQEGVLLEGTEGNNGKLPEYFTECSKKKVWWRCKAGHSWFSTIYNRALGNGYPYCSGRNAIAGYKDFFTMRPDLAGEWDYDKNQEIRLDQLAVNAHNKAWWKCNKGHSWHANLYSRANGSGGLYLCRKSCC